MLLRLRNSAAAMTSMVREQERTAHNLANSGTVGFKGDRTFTEILRQQVNEEGALESQRATRQWVDLSQGALQQTGNPLDVALQGEGFFVVSDGESDMPLYTRAGRFEVDNAGMLRTPQGLMVEGEGGPIQIPPEATSISIALDGTVEADNKRVGRLSVVTFEDPSLLERIDGATFSAPEGEEPLEAAAQVHQGFVESSNVNPVQEMTGMIEHLRRFEMQQRLLRSTDDNLSSSIRKLGGF